MSDDPEFKRLQAQLADVQKTAQAQAKRAEDAENARKSEALANGVRDALSSSGADAKRLGIALSHLKDRGLIRLTDKGEPAFVFTRDWGEDLVPAAKGAAEWLATEKGKFFVPPSGAQGTGDGVGKKTGDGSGGKPANAFDLVAGALASTF